MEFYRLCPLVLVAKEWLKWGEHGLSFAGSELGQTVLLPVGIGPWATHIVADAKALMPLPSGVAPCMLSPMMIIFKDITVRGFWLAKWFRTSAPEQQQKLYDMLTGLIFDTRQAHYCQDFSNSS
ncbi:MAG: hypothetical protein ACJAZ0_002317 [Halioglobus sp.]|jgi:hypothetical protein